MAIRAPALTNAGAEANARVLEDRNGSEEDAGENGDGESKEEGKAVDADFVDARDAGRGDGYEDAQSGKGKAQADEAAEQTENEAFEEEFAGDAVGTGAKCRADGEFLTAAFDADEEQVGDVGAGDKQDESDRAHEDPEHAADIADNVVFEGTKIGSDAGVIEEFGAEAWRSREGAGDKRKHAGNVGVGLFDGDARLETGKRFVAEIAEVGFVAIPF